MSIDYTVTGLYDDINATGLLPNNNGTYQDVDILRFMNKEIQTSIVPLLLSVNENYLLAQKDLGEFPASTSNYVQYQIPQSAIASKLKSITITSNNNAGWTFPRLDLNQIYSITGVYSPGFFIQQNTINITPCNFTGDLSLWFHKRPNKLVDPATDAGQITAINGTVLTLTQIPSTWAVGNTIDIIQNYPGFDTEVFGATITNLNPSASQITVNTLSTVTLSQVVSVGDYVALEYTSPIPQIPYECFPLLVQAATNDLLRGLGDQAAVQMGEQKYNEMKDNIINILTPRVDDATKKITRGGRGISDYSSIKLGWY